MAKIILKKANKDRLLSVTDGEWTALALINNLKIGRVDVEGLEFETPDFNKGAIKRAGSKQKWLKAVYDTDKMKNFRWKIAKETVKAAANVLGIE